MSPLAGPSGFAGICNVSRRWLGHRPQLSVAAQERKDLRGLFGRLLERVPVPAVVEQDEARVGDMVQDGDADFIRSYRPGITDLFMPARSCV